MGQKTGDDAGTLVWSNETQKDDWLKETSTFPPSVMGLMSGEGPGEMAAITSAGGVQVDSVLLPSVMIWADVS